MSGHRCRTCLGRRFVGLDHCEHCNGSGREPQRPADTLLSQVELDLAATEREKPRPRHHELPFPVKVFGTVLRPSEMRAAKRK